MLNSKISLGTNFYFQWPSKYFNYFEINAFFRAYPWGKIFFLGIGLGYWNYNFYSYSDNGFTFVPEIGWKIDVGKVGGFYLMPYITFPVRTSLRSFEKTTFSRSPSKPLPE
jgi:hypothetical protein